MLKKDAFWKTYKRVVLVLLFLIICTWTVLFVFLKSYEAGRPEHLADTVTTWYEKKKLDKVVNYVTILNKKYNTEDTLKKSIEKTITGDISYIKKVGTYTKDNPVYSILNDNKEIAIVTLNAKDKKGLFGINRWSIKSIEPVLNTNTIKVYAPSNANISINGTLLDNDVLKNEKYYTDDLTLFSKFVPIESFYEYEVTDIYDVREVTTSIGNLINNENEYTCIYDKNDEILNGVSDSLKEICMNYTRYVANETGFYSIAGNVYPGSDIYNILKGISATNRWSGYHTTTEFGDINFTNMQMFNSKAFKINVNYKYHYTSDVGYQEFESNLTIYMVENAGAWQIVNLTT